ncbi:YusW family protein [Planococcus chinensis]|uniref:YusW family protein n=1 Tax=Planococcus chinensis TaxID=272917 RepID=A0ABW4QD61_9BACL
MQTRNIPLKLSFWGFVQCIKGKEKVKFESKSDDEKVEYQGSEAVAFIQGYLTQWNLSPDMTKEELEAVILASFGQEVKELEVKVKFSNDKNQP